MNFLIIARDKPAREGTRDELRATRIAWLEKNQHFLVAAGGMVDDRNVHVGGGLMIVDAQDRAAAEHFANEDPFMAAGLYESLEVIRWRKVFFNYHRITTPDPFVPD